MDRAHYDGLAMQISGLQPCIFRPLPWLRAVLQSPAVTDAFDPHLARSAKGDLEKRLAPFFCTSGLHGCLGTKGWVLYVRAARRALARGRVSNLLPHRCGP